MGTGSAPWGTKQSYNPALFNSVSSEPPQRSIVQQKHSSSLISPKALIMKTTGFRRSWGFRKGQLTWQILTVQYCDFCLKPGDES